MYFPIVRPCIDCKPASYLSALKLSSIPLTNTKSCAVLVKTVLSSIKKIQLLFDVNV